jgi:hypothetical protein
MLISICLVKVAQRHPPNFDKESSRSSLPTCSTSLPRSLLRLALHLSTRESLQITTRHCIPALRESLLASVTVFCIFLCPFIWSFAILPRWFGGGDFIVNGYVKEVCFVCGFGVCALTFCYPRLATLFYGRVFYWTYFASVS